MVKESMVSGAKLVLEYLERNSKRYEGKQKPPAKLNKHSFSFKDRFWDMIRDTSVRVITSGGQTASSPQKRRAVEMSSHSETRSLQTARTYRHQNAAT